MVRYAIVGAGLAGVRLATALLHEGISGSEIIMVDGRTEWRGSEAPAAILHPFPGRTISPKAEGWAEFRRARAWLERVVKQGFTSIRRLPMVRPLDNPDIGHSLRSSWAAAEYDLPPSVEGHVVPGSQLSCFRGVPTNSGSALWYRPAFVVDLGGLVRWYIERLADEGVTFFDHRVERLQYSRTPAPHWRFDAPEAPIAREIILAVGHGLHRWFPNLATSETGGELAVFHPDGQNLDAILNASGHLAPAPGGSWVVGSTWWTPDREGRRPASAGDPEDILRDKGTALHPRVASMHLKRIWSGIRVSFGDHQPLSGPIPGIRRAHVLGALGSTGLYRSAYHAERLAGFLVHENALPPLADPRRMSETKWSPTPSLIGLRDA
jgi:glycine/D-amino acid oxidase-like deaminating enzyme